MSSPFKVNTRSQWAALSPVLMAGEPGLESDTGNICTVVQVASA